MIEEQMGGWVKPRRQLTVLELKQMIAEKEAELEVLNNELFNLENGPRLQAVAQIRNIMRAQQLTLADISKR